MTDPNVSVKILSPQGETVVLPVPPTKIPKCDICGGEAARGRSYCGTPICWSCWDLRLHDAWSKSGNVPNCADVVT